jgi:hypothetical protein
MKKVTARRTHDRVCEELHSEYHFDYAKAKRNRFAGKARKVPLVVVLDEDIAKVFKTPESVKIALRSIISTMHPRSKGGTTSRIAAGKTG